MVNDTSSLRLPAGQRDAVHCLHHRGGQGHPNVIGEHLQRLLDREQHLGSLATDPLTASSVLSPQPFPESDPGLRDLRDQFPLVSDQLFVTRPCDVPDPLRHTASNLFIPGKASHRAATA
ncbi:hypothetical protein [Streptomyces djakartensis]|uniref:hypothetical protein n=1 Tax=Streptomyces djakartensis TaxID=68193 RepID=UPI0034DFD68A